MSFWKEADTLAGLNHPNVLRFYGVVVDDMDDSTVVGIMTEYMNRGSLSVLLKARTTYLSLRERLDIALQVASGMAYLAKMDVVHVCGGGCGDNVSLHNKGDFVGKLCTLDIHSSHLPCTHIYPALTHSLISNPTTSWSMGMHMGHCCTRLLISG